MKTSTLTTTQVWNNKTCANFKNSTCKCGLQTKSGCSVVCVGYTPNMQTRAKLHIGTWKYSYSWIIFGCLLSLVLLMVKGL